MIDVSRRRFLAGVGSACAATAGPGGATVQGAASAHGRQDSRDEPLADLEQFVDERMAETVGEDGADGATVAVVRDGEVFAKGYGHAYYSPETPVDAEETLFRIGSVSKAITWTAAMQQVDRGAVATDVDVNDYLDSVSVPDSHDEPITLADLATHTPGFAIRMRGDKVGHADNVRPLAEAVRTNPPARVRPPGELPAYTNYAAALTGLLVGDVLDVTFADAVQRTLFGPLGMDASTFDAAPDGLVPGQRAVSDVVDWYSDVAPASGMHSTAADMAQFLRVHLNSGTVDGERVLSAGAVDEMHRQWFTLHERFDGIAFGFVEESRGDARLLRHGGGVPDFRTDLVLAPERDLGLFVSFHGEESGTAVSTFVDEFLDESLPVAEPTNAPKPDGRPDRADELEGAYRSVRGADSTTYEKLPLAVFSGSVQVSIADDGALVTSDGSDTDRWVEVEPRLFRHVDGDDLLWFRENDGELTHLVRESGFLNPFETIERHETMGVQAVLAGVAAVLLLSGLVGWPLLALWRRLWSDGATPVVPRRARRVGWATASWPLVTVLVALVTVVLASVSGTPPLQHRTPPGFVLAFLVPVVGALGTVQAGVYAGRAWRDGSWRLLGRVHYTLVVLASVTMLWVFHYWNLVGPVT